MRYLKKIWKAFPAPLREWPLKVLCAVMIRPRAEEVRAVAGEPVYLLGNFQSGGGISRSVELYAGQAEAAGQALVRVDTSREIFQTPKNPIRDASIKLLADIKKNHGPGALIIHLNPPQFNWLLCRLGQKFLRKKRIIAYWSWELEDIPEFWKYSLNFVDEIQVPSSFVRAAVAKNTTKPIEVLPHHVPQPPASKRDYGLSGKLRCLYLFDMASLNCRKNPSAAIEAFVKAFTPEQAELTIKIGQAHHNQSALRELEELVSRYPNIKLLTGWLDEEGLRRLYLEHDLYISLHRSEGYGLTIREAMLHNLYIVATGWSGNMDFMRGEKVFPVPYTLIPVTKADGIFSAVKNARWAEPDVDKAAEILRHVYGLVFSARIKTYANESGACA